MGLIGQQISCNIIIVKIVSSIYQQKRAWMRSESMPAHSMDMAPWHWEIRKKCYFGTGP